MDLQGLSTICAGLGIADEDDNGERIGYAKSEFCLENLKDLQRFLRRDDPQTRDVFKLICKWKIASKDMVPIIEHCQDDRVLVISAVKILVFLTMPIEPTSNDISQQIEYLWDLKASLTRNDTVAMIISLLEAPLENLEREAFSEDDWKLVQLVLTLFRNILAIQDISIQQKASGCATQYFSLRDRFLELLFSENVMDLILALTQQVGGSCGYLRQDNLLFLEIFHYICLGQEPDLIVKASQKGRKAEDVKASVNSLRSMMEEEEDKRRVSRQRNLDRYSQFSGTFTRLAMDGSKSLLKGNPGTASRDRALKPHTVHRGPIKRIVGDYGRLTSSEERILEQLHDFINQFLSGGYNELMQSVREDIEKEHPAIQKNDIVVFFQVAQFVTAFQRQKFLLLKKLKVEIDTSEVFVNKYADNTLFQGDICGPIAATMNEAMFSLVISKWRSTFDGLKETNDYKSLSAAGSLMKNMIHMLDLVLKLLPDDSKEPQTVRILLYKIFYDQTDQGLTQFLVTLIKSFNTHKQPKSDLADLVEMIHVVVRLMESLQVRGTLRVSRKSRRGRKKKILHNKNATADERLGENPVNPQDDVGDISCKQPRDSSMASMELFENSGFDEKGECVSVLNQIDESGIPPTDTGDVADNSGHDGNKNYTADERLGENPVNPEDDVGDIACKQPRDSSMASMELFENSGSDVKGECVSIPDQNDASGIPPTDTGDVADDSGHDGNKNYTADERLRDNLVNPQDDVGDISRKQPRDSSTASMELFENSGSDGKGECVSIPNQIDEFGIPPTDTGDAMDDSGHDGSKNYSQKPNSLEFGTDDSSEDDLPASTNEVDFKVSNFVSTFANNTIVQNLCWLLKFYKSNSISTNHYIICMFRRICDDLELSPMLYQLSLLTTFYDILAEQKSSNCKEYANIVSFLSNLVRKMMRKMKSQPLLFVEVLFWKTRRECHYINSESMINEVGELKKETRNWGNGDYEKTVPSQDNGRIRRSIADSLGDDDADVMTSESPHMASHQNKKEEPYGAKRQKVTHEDSVDEMRASTSNCEIEGGNVNSNEPHNEESSVEHKSHQVSKRKKRLVFDQELESDIKDQYENEGSSVKRKSHQDLKRKKRLVFDQELETDFKNLYEKFKDHKRYSHEIANALVDAGRTLTAAQVSRKIKQLGLRVPQKKRLAESKKHSGDVDAEDLHLDEREKESDEETLSVLKKRSKTNRKSNVLPEKASSGHPNQKIKSISTGDASDDEVLSSLLVKTGKKPFTKVHTEKASSGHPNQKIMSISTGDDSDDEVLSSLLVKTGKKPFTKVHIEKLITSSLEETIIKNDLATQLPEDTMEGDGHMPSTETDVPHVNVLEDGALPNQMSSSRNVIHEGVASMNNVDNGQDQEMHDKLADELEDSGDDMEPIVRSTSVVRRKLKMVIDFEDDE